MHVHSSVPVARLQQFLGGGAQSDGPVQGLVHLDGHVDEFGAAGHVAMHIDGPDPDANHGIVRPDIREMIFFRFTNKTSKVLSHQGNS